MTNPYAPPPADHGGSSRGSARQDDERRDDERPESHPPAGPADVRPQQAPPEDAGPPPGPQPGPDLPPERYGRRPVGDQGPRRPEDPAAYEVLRSRLGLFLLLLVASLVVLSLPLPFQAASVVFSAWAVVVGARAVVAAWRGGIRRAAVPLAAALVGIAMWMTLSVALQLALWPALQERQDCLREALTTSAREACEERYEQDVEDRLSRLLQPGPAGA